MLSAFAQPLERLLLTLWMGATWSIGYLVAPVLFQVLDDRKLAGALAGQMFDKVHLLGAICGGLLLLLALSSQGRRVLQSWRVWVLVVMLLLIAAIELYIRPQMLELKAQDMFSNPQLAAEFGKLHGASSVCYLINSLLGLLLVFKGVWTTAKPVV